MTTSGEQKTQALNPFGLKGRSLVYWAAHTGKLALGGSLLWVGSIGQPALGGTIIMPADVETGGTFQLAFVTSMPFKGTSSAIETYNAFVTAAAKAARLDEINGQAVAWTAIVSTATVSARDNAPQVAPVYNLNQELVTPNPGGLWDSRSWFFDNPIDVNERGVELSFGYVWTGTDIDGKSRPYYAMGSPYVVGVGDLSSRFTDWISTAVLPPGQGLHLYALSTPIVARLPNTVPEPSSLVILFSGTILTAVLYRHHLR